MFDLAALEAELASTMFAGKLHFSPVTGSTNSDAMAAARGGAPHGAVFLADEQTAARLTELETRVNALQASRGGCASFVADGAITINAPVWTESQPHSFEETSFKVNDGYEGQVMRTIHLNSGAPLLLVRTNGSSSNRCASYLIKSYNFQYYNP